MKTLQQKLEERALDKLKADIQNFSNAIEKICKSNNVFEKIASSVSFVNSKGDQISATDIHRLFDKNRVIELVKEMLLEDYIEAEVNKLLVAVEQRDKSN